MWRLKKNDGGGGGQGAGHGNDSSSIRSSRSSSDSSSSSDSDSGSSYGSDSDQMMQNHDMKWNKICSEVKRSESRIKIQNAIAGRRGKRKEKPIHNIISRQDAINIGNIGHLAHGKSTVLWCSGTLKSAPKVFDKMLSLICM